jgi:hypothetical protein
VKARRTVSWIREGLRIGRYVRVIISRSEFWPFFLAVCLEIRGKREAKTSISPGSRTASRGNRKNGDEPPKDFRLPAPLYTRQSNVPKHHSHSHSHSH